MAVEMPTNIGFRGVAFGLVPNTATFISPTNKHTQSFELPGAFWYGVYEVTKMTVQNAGQWKAFLTNLMGPSGRFNAFDPSQTSPFGAYSSGSDTPIVKGANQTGKSLITDGWRNSGSNLLLRGDYFELTINSIKRLFMVTADGSSDSSGNMTISIVPPLPESPTNNLVLVLSNPRVEMMLINDGQSLWNVPVDKLISGFSFAGREAP